MIRQDYILRLIEQFGRQWALFVKQLQAQLFHSARASLDIAYQETLGLSADAARALSAQELLARMLFAAAPELGRQRCGMLSALLKAEGELASAQGDPDVAAQYYQKALEIVLALSLQALDQPLPQYTPPPSQLIDALSDYQLPTQTNRLLFQYYEQSGAFAKAEDCLFELRAQSDAPSIAALGEAFYLRLRGRTDAELAAGNFSRPEIELGLAKWKEH